ncbi:hypothetical protein BC835DRAFT_1390613 [Cytidiella melzeri]|nr:hypothetical protein BC835DRAFT_1390613 [Cytidiella melzeri]
MAAIIASICCLSTIGCRHASEPSFSQAQSHLLLASLHEICFLELVGHIHQDQHYTKNENDKDICFSIGGGNFVFKVLVQNVRSIDRPLPLNPSSQHYLNDTGVRLYMKMPDGTVLVENNVTTEKEMQVAQSADDLATLQETKNWHRSQTTWLCDPESALAACWKNENVSLLFHQGEGRIRYWTDEQLPGGTPQAVAPKQKSATTLSSDKFKCTKGSKIAVVNNTDSSQFALFFQDVDGNICYSSGDASLNFSEPVPLCKAVQGSGLSVAAWTGIRHMRLYYQDEDFAIKEMALNENHEWVKGATVSTEPKALTTISALHWYSSQTHMSEFRTYYQTGPVKIAERCCGQGTKWAYNTGTTVFNTFVASYNIHAFLRCLNDGNPVITVWGATQERVLVQRVYNHSNGWLGATCYTLPRTHQDRL